MSLAEQQLIKPLLPLSATMSGMSAVDREIFSLLSETTAKQRLVAEQVRLLVGSILLCWLVD